MHRLLMFLLVMVSLPGCAAADETVPRGDLARVRNSCALAGMQFKAEPHPTRTDSSYLVACVQPVTWVRLDMYKHAPQVADCVRIGRDARIEVDRPGYPQVVCVRRIKDGL